MPKGYQLSTVAARIKYRGRQDMLLISSDVDATVAGTFTTNKVQASPVKHNLAKIGSLMGRAMVVNAGNANACNGKRGDNDSLQTVNAVAREMGIDPDLVYVCSTGVIGVPMPMDRLLKAVPKLVKGLGKASFEDASEAIMTTDTFPKRVTRKIKIAGKMGTISAICKGAGMIEPNMATMLCFIMTDLSVNKQALKSALKEAVGSSFNLITVDGERSTNDTAFIMANGMAGNAPIKKNTPEYQKFAKTLTEIAYELSSLIVKDGEGATKLIKIKVTGAKSDSDARLMAKSIANSLLVKTAVYGLDPNIGRIMVAAGYSGAAMDADQTDVHIGSVKVISNGVATGKEAKAKQQMMGDEVAIKVALKLGKGQADALTCDLTEKYIEINAEYTT